MPSTVTPLLSALALGLLPAAAPAPQPARPPVPPPRPAGVVVQHDRSYGPALAQSLDVYRPAGVRSRRPRPAIVWVHGGGFGAGSRIARHSAAMARSFAAAGYVALAIDYRLLAVPPCAGATLSTGRCVRASSTARDDARLALRWLRRHRRELNVDPRRIAIGGSSAGAITSLRVATEPVAGSRVAALVAISGGLPRTADIDATDPPAILFNGSDDAMVPFRWSVAVVDALRRAGVPAVHVVFPGAGHDLWPHRPEIARRAIAFLDAHLRARASR